MPGHPGERPPGAPLYAFDAAFSGENGRSGPLAGADEAGRGSLAGPLVAAAVVLGEGEVEGLADSKTLRPEARETVFAEVLRRCEGVSVASFPAWWIDRYGVGSANREALRGALSALADRAGCCLADGNLRLRPEVESLPRADSASATVAAASVVAKVLRDGAMRALAAESPGYGFERNKGYGTPEHRLALRELGPCRVHRVSWSGVGG
ncbi:MAG: ribonuclease HII [Rubrobacter sp.]|nr:ribonuclease HII [Rubrobacter sp.]